MGSELVLLLLHLGCEVVCDGVEQHPLSYMQRCAIGELVSAMFDGHL
jgi:hypothetical protein